MLTMIRIWFTFQFWSTINAWASQLLVCAQNSTIGHGYHTLIHCTTTANTAQCTCTCSQYRFCRRCFYAMDRDPVRQHHQFIICIFEISLLYPSFCVLWRYICATLLSATLLLVHWHGFSWGVRPMTWPPGNTPNCLETRRYASCGHSIGDHTILLNRAIYKIRRTALHFIWTEFIGPSLFQHIGKPYFLKL